MGSEVVMAGAGDGGYEGGMECDMVESIMGFGWRRDGGVLVVCSGHAGGSRRRR